MPKSLELSRLTPKHRKFIKMYFETSNATASARMCGFKPSYGRDLVNDPRIVGALYELQVKAGLTDDLLLRTHVELLGKTSDGSVRLGALRLGYQVTKKLDFDAPPPGAPPAIVIIMDDSGTNPRKSTIQINPQTDVSIQTSDG